MDVRMPDGTVVTGVPEDITKAELLARYTRNQVAAPTDRTIGQSVTDVGAGLLTGLGKVGQFPGQLYGLATGDFTPGVLTQNAKALEVAGARLESPQLKAAKVERDTAVQEAAKTGEWEAFKTTFSRTVSNPALITNFLAETAPQLIPSFGAARAVSFAMAGKKALTGEAKEAAAKKAGAAGTAAAIGTGAAQQGADIGAQTFEDISKHLEKNGMSKEEAAAASIGYARATGAGAAVISLLAQKLPGAKRMEEAFAGVPGTQKGVIGRFVSAGKTGAGEAGSEVVEETGGKLLQNVAMQQEAPETQLTAGLGQTAAMAALGGAGMGAGVGAISPSAASPEAAPEVPGAEVPAGEVTPTTEGEVTPPEVIPTTEVTPPEETTEVPPTEEEPSIGDYHIGKIEPLAPMFNQIQTKAEQQDVVAQMESVATNPDYSLLGKSDNIDTGAPVIISDYKIPNDLMGNVEEITGENGDNIKVQYAVLEADGILTANSIEGMPNPDYTNTEERGTRAIYGNNRLTGLQAAYNNGTATDYTPALLDDPAHGIDPAVIAGMDRPVLVRVIPKSTLLPKEAETTDEAPPDTTDFTGESPAISEEKFGEQLGAEVDQGPTWVSQSPGLMSKRSPELSAAVSNKDVPAVIQHLQKSKNPVVRMVAELASKAPDFTISLFAGTPYSRRKNAVGLYTNNQVFLRDQITASNEDTVAHEIVHHLTVSAINQPTPEQLPAIARLDKLFLHVKKLLKKEGRVPTVGKTRAYGLTNTKEFLSEGMSNPAFQYELRKIKYQNTTAWGAFTRIVGQILGIKNDTALSELIAIAEELSPQVERTEDTGKPISKVDTGKLISGRSQELQDAFAKLQAGEITKKDYEDIVNKYRPVTPYTSVPAAGSEQDAKNALTANQRDKFGIPSKTLTKGYPVGIRLDIPSSPSTKKPNGVWVSTVHEKGSAQGVGKAIGYETATAISNPTFIMSGKAAGNIAAGGEKSPMATIKGGWNPLSKAEIEALANKHLNDPEWAQVGMDPTRHAYFYNRATLQPIVGGTEMLQVGPLFLVKNPKYEGKETFDYKEDVSNKSISDRIKKILPSQKDNLPPEQFDGVDPAYVDQLSPIFDPKKTTIVDKIKSLRENFWAKMAQGLADQYRTIKDYSEEGYMLARLSKSVDGMLEGLLFNGEATLTDGALDVKKNTQGLMKVMEPVGTEVSRYQIWVALSRDADLVKSGKAPSVDKGIVKRRDELVKGTLNGRPRLEVYKEVQRGMNKLNRSVLRIALKQGLIDLAAYKIFARDINYIPFYKIMEDGDLQNASTATGLANQYFSKGLKGGEKPFGDLMENTLRNWSHILSASMKNQALGTTLKDATELGASYPNLKKGLDWKDGKVIHSSTGKPIGDGSLKPQYTTAGKGMVKVMMGGTPAYFEVIDPMLVESISAISYTGPQSKFLDVARDFKNILQFGVTISPAFKIRNLFRDSAAAMAVTDLKYNPFTNVIEGWIASNKNNPAHISALSGGAIFNFGTLYEGNQAKLIKRLLAMGVKPENILDTPDKVKTGLSVAWRAYQDWGNKSESANRMALYNQLKERGMNHMQATFYARDLLDFSMQGAFPAMRYLTQVVPFLNARVQGLYKLGRDGIMPTSRVIYNASTGKPIDATDKQKAQRFSIVSGAVALASLALYFAFKDDEEFKKREDWDRDNFWWFKLPGMEHAIRIPKPFEIGAIGTMAERVAEQIVDNKAEGKVFGHSLARMMGDTFAMNPMPQMFKPLVDLYANKDSFTGAPIETAGMERLSKAERASDTTSTLAKSVSGVANTVLPESLHMSPVQADYAIKSYFGWLGGTISATSNYAVMPFSKSVYPDRNWTDTISLGFVKSLPSAQNKAVTAFYENNREIQTAFADMRHYAAIGEVGKVNDILKEKGDKIALSKSYNNASDDMAKMRKYISVINRDEKMDGAQKRAEIDRMKILIGKLAEQMEDVRKSIKK